MKKEVIEPRHLPKIEEQIKNRIKKYERQKGHLTVFSGFEDFNQNDLIRFAKETEEILGDIFPIAKKIGISYEEFNKSYILDFNINGKKYRATPNKITKAIKDKVEELRLQEIIGRLNDGLVCVRIWNDFMNTNDYEEDMNALRKNLEDEIDFIPYLSDDEDENEDGDNDITQTINEQRNNEKETEE